MDRTAGRDEAADQDHSGAPTRPVVRQEQVRACGDCAICCKLIPISGDDIDCAADEWCRHARPGRPEGGCSIWAERPEQCRAYVCAWAQGILPEEMHPRKARLMVGTVDHPHWGLGWWIYELNEGAMRTKHGAKLWEWLRTREETIPFAVCTGTRWTLYDRLGRLLYRGGSVG